MHPTRNDLPAKARSGVARLLGDLLADAVDLQTQVKQAHWTVKGPTFLQLHELFDAVAGEVESWADLLAERIAQLGGTPVGTARHAAKSSRLPEYPLAAVRGSDHVRFVSDRLAAFAAAARTAIDAADDMGDAVTADICTEVCRGADKQLWFVESHAPKFA